jgi:hypothetical protein
MLYRLLADIFTVKTEPPADFHAPELNWFEGIQVLTARDSDNTAKGLFFTAKGGNNGESHNHNDVGNFLLYADCVPALVDAGVEQYTKFTFSDKRYDLWTMQSGYHNTPTINGYDQAPGTNYHADGVSCTGDNGKARLVMDLAGAYPVEAGIQSYKREFIFEKGKGLTVTDEYSLKEARAPLILNFLCYEKPEFSGDTVVLSGKILMHIDSSAFTQTVEEIPLKDEKIHKDWKKDSLYRIRFTKKEKETSGKVQVRFTLKVSN